MARYTGESAKINNSANKKSKGRLKYFLYTAKEDAIGLFNVKFKRSG